MDFIVGGRFLGNIKLSDNQNRRDVPVVTEEYCQQQKELLGRISEPIDISLDGQYDSPGYSAELCAVTAVEDYTKQVLAFSVFHRSEVGGISGRMELAGVKKTLEFLNSEVGIKSVMVDKHLQVCAYLKSEEYTYHFDPWHMLKSTQKRIRNALKGLKSEEEKILLRDLGRKLIIHIYAAVESYWGMTMPNLNTIYLNEMCFERPIFLITTLMHEIKHIVADLEERKGFRSTIKYYYRVLTVHDYCHKGHFLNGLQNIEANYGVYILGNRILEGYDSAEKKKWKQQADVFRSIISGVMHRSWISCYKARIYSAKRKIWKNV
uniref:Uncharacterized protein n=1 Tax=Ditylenchus dipsaci TaxID=166011 RepID=A0A915DWL2_9BILA